MLDTDKELEKMRLEMQIKKAESAIAEYRFKVAERLKDIKRLEDNIEQQEELLDKYKEELREL